MELQLGIPCRPRPWGGGRVTAVVLDAPALLALLLNEPGATRVAALLRASTNARLSSRHMRRLRSTTHWMLPGNRSSRSRPPAAASQS